VKVRVLGCAGAELPGFNPPAFLVNGRILLDAGTIGAALTQKEQEDLELAVITHAHLDHVRGIPSLADNLVIGGSGRKVIIAGLHQVLGDMRRHLLNNAIWPDFSAIPSEEEAVIDFLEMEPGQVLCWEDCRITLCPVNHCVPAAGILVRQGEASLLYTGDTGPTERIWRMADDIDALIVEVSFPNAMEKLALTAGHLTPRLLAREMEKPSRLPPRILVTHPKPSHLAVIERELRELGIPGMSLLTDGMTFEV
jgi:ribonuclease BN (tRNA processing enzyme)